MVAASDANAPGQPVNVICVKWGTRYPAYYVNRLFAMISRNLAMPFRFACFTDDPAGVDPHVECFPIPNLNLPARHEGGGWRKLALLAPQLADLRGDALFLDLDVIISGDLACFFQYPGELCIIENWTQSGQGVGNSSVFRFEVGSLADAFAKFDADPERFANLYPNEQTYLSLAEKQASISFWPDDWVKSFKLHCVPPVALRAFQPPRIPRGARIVAFHGNPKMEEAARGKALWDRRPHYKSSVPWFWRAAPWVDELWRVDARP